MTNKFKQILYFRLMISVGKYNTKYILNLKQANIRVDNIAKLFI